MCPETRALVEEAGTNVVVRPRYGFRGSRAWVSTWEGAGGAVTGSLLMAGDEALSMDSALVVTRGVGLQRLPGRLVLVKL